MQIKTILVPTDFSEDSKRALEIATDLARSLGSRIVLLHAYHIDLAYTSPAFGAPVVLPEGFYEQCRKRAQDQIEHLAKESGLEGIDVSVLAIERPAWSAILDEAKSLPADLIVMGTRGLTGIKHVAFGSTAERVVRKASCPVLTVKAD